MTRKILLASCLLIASILPLQNAFSQPFKHTSEFSMGLNHIDRSLRVDHWIGLGRHGIRLGGKYHMWWYTKDDQNYVLKDRALPRSPMEKYGFQVGYTYFILTTKTGFGMYAFYDAQFSNTSFKIQDYIYQGNVIIGNNPDLTFPAYTLHKAYRVRHWVSEQNVGIGLTIPIASRLMLNEMAGIGLATVFWGKDKLSIGTATHSELIIPFLRIGVCWKWGKQIEP